MWRWWVEYGPGASGIYSDLYTMQNDGLVASWEEPWPYQDRYPTRFYSLTRRGHELARKLGLEQVTQAFR